jgi:hypothetical protein
MASRNNAFSASVDLSLGGRFIKTSGSRMRSSLALDGFVLARRASSVPLLKATVTSL